MHLPEFMRSLAFRWTIVVSGTFIICILLMFGFVLAQTYAFMKSDIEGLITDVSKVIAEGDPESRIQRLNEHLRVDPRRVKIAGLFTAYDTRIAGNVESLPPSVKADASPQLVSLIRIDALGRDRLTVRAVARRLPEGNTLLVARSDYEFGWIVDILERALAIGLIPALCLACGVAAFLNGRAQNQVKVVNSTLQRFVAGELWQRVPARGAGDPFGKLAILVNEMLDEIETLVRRLAGVGDDIAHDLRTPLTRVRIGLERAQHKAGSVEEFRTSVDQAIVGLDQSLAMITALLRVAEIEQGRRFDGFGHVELRALVREVGDLYEPFAEEKKISFAIDAKEDVGVYGDRDLLFEAVANLVDNAMKFTPQGGRVELSLYRRDTETILRVRDTGPGISTAETGLVTRRFYRSDKSRREPGLGLGLSLVSSIVKLHRFRFSISAGPGCVAEITTCDAAPQVRVANNA